jgi:hypothetical protein
LYELSDGRINLSQSEEELSTTTDLIRTNKKMSNKAQQPLPKHKGGFQKKNNNNNNGKKFIKKNHKN